MKSMDDVKEDMSKLYDDRQRHDGTEDRRHAGEHRGEDSEGRAVGARAGNLHERAGPRPAETEMKPTLPPILLSAKESAAFLGVSLRTFRNSCKEPGFPAARQLSERNSRWVRTELEAWAVALPPAKLVEPDELLRARAERGD